MIKPEDLETRSEFVARCIGDFQTVDDFPDDEQRFAVCSRLWDDSGKSMKHKFCAFEVKEADDAGHVTGYASTFGNVDQGGDIVAKGAFERTLKERDPVMLWGHDSFAPAIGVWNELKEDEHGLFVDGVINLKSERGIEVHSGLMMGAIKGMSIGYMDIESDVDRKTGVRTLTEVDLFENSFVNFPMNVEAQVETVKANLLAGTITKRSVERILRDAGFSNAQARAFISDGFSGLKHRDDEDDIDSELQKAIQVFS